jgi:hypothetical protein
MEAINKLHVSRSQKNLIPIQPVERSSGEWNSSELAQ